MEREVRGGDRLVVGARGLVLLLGLQASCASKAPAPVETAPPPAAVAPAADTLPEAAALFESYVAALGGRARVLRGQSFVARGTLSAPDQGVEGELVHYMQSPNKSLTVLDMPGFGEVREGFDGAVAWIIHPMTGPRVKAEEERADVAHRSVLHHALRVSELYRSMRTVRRKVFGAHEVFVVELVTKDGRDETLYFDVESRLLVGREAMTPTDVGEVRAVSRYEEYRDFGGLAFPTRIEQRLGPSESVILIREVEENPSALPSFEPPPEVRALLAEPVE